LWQVAVEVQEESALNTAVVAVVLVVWQLNFWTTRQE
jgi:hypothetical protein